jgi:predicted ATPase with chaperone activity
MNLAHRGVLVPDGLPEYGQQVIDVMRQPLEDQIVTIIWGVCHATGMTYKREWRSFRLITS